MENSSKTRILEFVFFVWPALINLKKLKPFYALSSTVFQKRYRQPINNTLSAQLRKTHSLSSHHMTKKTLKLLP